MSRYFCRQVKLDRGEPPKPKNQFFQALHRDIIQYRTNSFRCYAYEFVETILFESFGLARPSLGSTKGIKSGADRPFTLKMRTNRK